MYCWRSIVKKVQFFGYICSWLIVGGLVLEVLLRIFYPHTDIQLEWIGSRNYMLDKDLIYSRIPNGSWTWSTGEFDEIVTSNNLGFRDKPIGKKEKGTYRIIAVGDSFTFGHGIRDVNDTYPKQLESYLQTLIPHKSIEVINAGEKGYSPDQEYTLIRKKIVDLDPDLIIWNFSIPGDIYNLVHQSGFPNPSLYDIRNDKLVPLNAKYNWLYASNYFRYHFPILNKSYLYNIGVRLISDTPVLSRKSVNSSINTMHWAAKKIQLEVEDVFELSKRHKFQLLVTFLPYPVVFEQTFKNSDIARVVDSIELNIHKQNVAFVNVQKEMTDDLIQAQDQLQDGDKKNVLGYHIATYSSYYHTIDYHFNEKGTRAAAQIIGNYIHEQIL